MMRMLVSHPPCMEMLLHVVLRDKLSGLPILTDHLRWACQLATQAARNPHFSEHHISFSHKPSGPGSGSGSGSFLGSRLAAAGAVSPSEETLGHCLLDEDGACTRGSHWLHRSMLVKALIVGQLCPDPRVLQQVRNMTRI